MMIWLLNMHYTLVDVMKCREPHYGLGSVTQKGYSLRDITLLGVLGAPNLHPFHTWEIKSASNKCFLLHLFISLPIVDIN